MSEQRKRAPGAELEAQYRAHGQAEPDAGLDRMIRARADQALARSRPRRPAPWIAGLASAGALVLAVGLIVQQTPPAPDMAPTAPPAPGVSDDAAPALRSAPRPARSAAEPQAGAARAPQAEAESAFMAELAETAPDAAARQLLEIRELIAAGELKAAREQLETLKNERPELEIPEDLARALKDPLE